MSGETALAVRAHLPEGRTGAGRLDVDLALSQGITVVMGPSGAGKTTLLTAVAGLVRPRAGRISLAQQVLFDSESGAWVPPHRRRIALVFQSLALFPHLSAADNVAYGLLPGLAKSERRAQVQSWLERARVGHLAKRLPASLSGGEAQRVALARALASSPRALLLDEPFSALDRALRLELRQELAALVTQLDIPALLVTHHEEDARALGSRIITLTRGAVVEDSGFSHA